jgi:dTDP-4-dehydrorhamnose reductase
MHILLLGHHGQLGWELQRTLAPLGQVSALDYPQIDLSQPESVRGVIKSAQPSVILNATAYTNVDQAENEPGLVMAINARAPGVLAEVASEMNIVLIHYSTDYVFDGGKGSPYAETDPPNPLNLYGKSKLAGEQAIGQVDGNYLILRTSWVYSLRRENFVTHVLKWSRQQRTLRIVADQVGNPTWARMLAEATALLLFKAGEDHAGWFRERKGIYHLAGSGYTSRFDWAQAILRFDPHSDEQIAEEIQPALTSEFPTPAQRPLYSALDDTLFNDTFGFRLPGWEHALGLALQNK